MVMPGAQGQGYCWGSRRGWSRKAANRYGVVGHAVVMRTVVCLGGVDKDGAWVEDDIEEAGLKD